MRKPPWRDNDDSPTRSDDIQISFLGFTLAASGRMVVLIILVLAVGALGIFHDVRITEAHARDSDAHERLAEGFLVMTCVLTLNDVQKEEFRTLGKFCGHDSAFYRMRKGSNDR